MTSLGLHWPFSRPRAIPILFNTSISSWISKVLSKLNKYSYLKEVYIKIKFICYWTESKYYHHFSIGYVILSLNKIKKIKLNRTLQSQNSYLSLDMEQSMTVFLLVLTIIKGSCIAEFCGGGPCVVSSSLFLITRFLNAICC